MIPSASSTAHQIGSDLTWQSAADSWPDQAAAAAHMQCSGLDSRYLNLNRQQILDWENAMLLAQHSNNCSGSVYDQEVDYKHTMMQQAEAIGSFANSRHYDDLLSVNMNSSGLSQNTWGLSNTVGADRNSGRAGGLQHERSFIQASLTPYNNGSLGASAMGGYSSLGANGAAGLYGDPLAARSSVLALTGFDQRRLEDIVKRELYTTHDFDSRLGLNLGGRTYFSADDYNAFGRFGKRPRPNPPTMIQAPLCQAEGCKADLSMAKHYHRRHKVCEYHSKAAQVNIGGQTQRFCQQCSRFHMLSEFDDGKRSCRKRLADHNRRRRKPQSVPSLAIAAEAKDSEEVTAGSEGLHNGGQSSKASPTVGDQQPLGLASATPSAGLSSGHNELTEESKMAQVSEESMDKAQPKEAPTSNTFRWGSAIATSTISASLSLGATHDHKQAGNGVRSGAGAAANFSAAGGDHKSGVPWLQASHANNQLGRVSCSTKASESPGEAAGDRRQHHAGKVASLY